ncbi:MAG: thiol reductant ABC exporter subunit CydD [Agromyces sp.]
MTPFDPRLLRESRAIRRIVGFGVLWALLHTASVVLFATSGSRLIVSWFDQRPSETPLAVLGLLVAAATRAAAQWVSATTSARNAARAKAEIRSRALAALGTRGLAVSADHSRSDVTLLLGRGLDALDDYFTGFLPSLLLAATATPLLALAILLRDVPSALTIAIVLPLIPVFMTLIGRATQSVQRAQWLALSALGRQFLDLLDGLSTLKIFRRARAQIAAIDASGAEYRIRTMRVLRVSFLSSFTLELAATLSVALVAVLIGTRLVSGALTLDVGLFVLLLVPDVFAPIRQVGASFHAAADGLTASQRVFSLIDAAAGASECAAQPAAGSSLARPGVTLDGLEVRRGDRIIVSARTEHFAPGAVHVITGPSGTGKSTLLAGILGFAATRGSCTVDGDTAVRERVAWVPQGPSLSAGSIAENVALGAGEPNLELVRDCLDRLGLSALDAETRLGVSGAGLSGGQAQRVAIARALYRVASNPQVRTVICDEPTSALDEDSQARVIAELQRLARSGLCVIAVSHRDRLVAAADTVIEIGQVA